jgi:hypothetical protein
MLGLSWSERWLWPAFHATSLSERLMGGSRRVIQSRIMLTRRRAHREIVIGQLTAGETVTVHASQALRPSWVGSDDKRLLSFCVRTDD